MNDYDLINALLEELKDGTRYWTIVIFLILNFIAILGVFFLQFYLKAQEKKHYRIQLKEDRRIGVYEKLYSFFDELSFFDGRVDNALFLDKITECTKYLTKNKLYISRDIYTISKDFLDYYRTVLSDFRQKSIQVEDGFYDAFISNFNK